MTRRLMNLGTLVRGVIWDDSVDTSPIQFTDVDGDGSTYAGKALVADSNGKFVPTSGVTGDISGPGSSTDNALPRWDGALGTLLQNSGVLVDDSNNMDIPGQLTMGSSNIVITLATGYLDPGSIDQDGASTNQVLAWNGSAWVPTSVSGVGGISGTLGSTDNVLMRSDGTGGSTAQGSVVVVNDSGNMSGVGTLGCGAITSTGAISGTTGTFSSTSVNAGGNATTDTTFIANSATANYAGMSLKSAGNTRWFWGREATTDDMRLLRYTGSSSLQAIRPITIANADGAITFGNNVTMNGSLGCGAITSSGAFSNSGFALTTNAITCTGFTEGSSSAGSRNLVMNCAAGNVNTILFQKASSNTASISDDATDQLVFKTGTNTTALTLSATQNATFAGNVTHNGQILFDDAHGMYIEPSAAVWNFGANSASNLTAAFGNAGAGTMSMTLDGVFTSAGLVSSDYGFLASGGFLQCGVSGTARGAQLVYHGAGGNTAGYIVLYSRNGTATYLWVEDDRTLKISSTVPVNNADGTVVGTQT